MKKILILMSLLVAFISANSTTRIEEISKEKPLIGSLLTPKFGDIKNMIKDRKIRVLLVNDGGFYGLKKGRNYGLYRNVLEKMEEELNKDFPNEDKNKRIKLIPIPIKKADLLDTLNKGYGDMVLSGNIITKEKKQQINYTKPFGKGFNNVLVTSKHEGEIRQYEDLSGKEVFIEPTSEYLKSLVQVSETMVIKGLKPIIIRALPAQLSRGGILELINDKVIGVTVMEDYKAEMWKLVYKDIVIHEDITFGENKEIAIMVRKDSPKLLEKLNEFIDRNIGGKVFTKKLTKRYTKNIKYLKDVDTGLSEKEYVKIKDTFKKYAKQYKLDPLILMAQAYQESKLQNNARSHVGAQGIMQLMKGTARDMKVGSIRNIEGNIHAGVKYHRQIRDNFYKEKEISKKDKILFIFAGYNAGPTRIKNYRKLAKERGLNPNIWHDNVEQIVAEKIGRETIQYIENIYTYYVAYTMINIEKKSEIKAKLKMYAMLRQEGAQGLSIEGENRLKKVYAGLFDS